MTTELETPLLARLLRESYGPGAWHGPDFKAALADVPAELAFWRPAAGRHNIAEIAIHHLFYVHAVRGRLTGADGEPFFLEGDDWFVADGHTGPDWERIQAEVEKQHALLAETLDGIEAGLIASPLRPAEQLDQVLGVACHGIYHAGQIQLLRRLHG